MLTTELKVLALAGLLLTVQYLWMSVAANIDLGWRWTTSPRDLPPERQMRPVTGRLVRALDNLFQALIFYTLAVVLVILTDRQNFLTAGLAWLWLAARVIYVPAYAFGWSPWRSAIWGVGFTANLLMIVVTIF